MHRSIFAPSLALAVLALPVQASAQVAGAWRVTGDVADHGFALDCHFEPHKAGFGGTCIEAGGSDGHVRPGKIHTLSQGSLAGQQVRWAYPVSVMFISFDINFAGTLSGNTISGDVSASGRKGKFTAVRQ